MSRPSVVRPSVVRLGARTTTALVLVSVAGLAMFLWPLLIVPPEGAAPGVGAPAVFVLIMPAILAILLAELSSGELDTKAVAMLGVLTAIGAALRPLGAGVAGIETIFFLLVLAGRVYGPGFGFVLGTTTMFASAILTGGLGPWLPFQMLASGWVGLGAGLLPRRVTGRAELAMLAAYGAVSAFAFGFVLNMWFWPYTIGADTQLSYVAGGPVVENLQRFFLYTVATSTLGWDMGRAITNVVAILVLGPTILAVLHRASRRAAFDASSAFDPSPAGASAYHQRP
jgi:energy-coupling factor transport system substrate-specific component